MTRICLDTSAYSNFRRGQPDAVAWIDQAEWVGVPSVVLGELWAGFAMGSQAHRSAESLAEFLAHPLVEVLVVDADAARIFGEVFVDLRAQKKPVPTNDLWVATTIRAGATVRGRPRPHRGVLQPVGNTGLCVAEGICL